MATETPTPISPVKLHMPVVSDIANAIGLVAPQELTAEGIDETLQAKAQEFVDKLFALNTRKPKELRAYARSIDTLGDSLEKEIQHKSKMLTAPMNQMIEANQDGEPVEAKFTAIYAKLKEIDPNQADLSMRGFRSLFAKLPFIGDPMIKWAVRYVSVAQAIEEMTDAMKGMVREMKRDNDVLLDDQDAMKEIAFKLEDVIRWGKLVDSTIVERMEAETNLTAAKTRFLEEDILFQLRQNISQLAELQGINYQGVLVAQAIVDGNKELIRGYDSGIKTTMAAIRIAASLSVALQKQSRNRALLTAINDYKGKLVRETGEQLKANAQAIAQEAGTAGARIEELKAGFTSALESFDILSNYRRDYLPQLAENIQSLTELTGKMDEAVTAYVSGERDDEAPSPEAQSLIPA